MAIFVTVNRWLYGALLVVGATVTAIPWLDAPEAEPTLPPVTVPPVKVIEHNPTELTMPVGNVFDPDGRHWEPKAVANAAAGGQQQQGGPQFQVRGIVRLGETQGILTDKQFVPVGKALGNERVESVGDGRVVLRTNSGVTSEYAVDPERQKRRERILARPDSSTRALPARRQTEQ
ncbi:MAG: hypothetical protein HY246_03710 [Proteobacteria bacterium]|nr:hypothetical protein [Pseudomonadota bacterium]